MSKEEINQLLERRPIIEIIEVSSQEREKILRKAEAFMLKLPSKLAFNGGSTTQVDLAIGRSLLEFFVRDEATEYSKNPLMATITSEVYENALRRFMRFVEEIAPNYALFRSLWMTKAKLHINNIFSRTDEVFEPYVIGELCENLFLDNKSAKTLLEEFKREKFVQVVGSLYQESLLAKR
jgi:hypothetical protein